MKNKIKYIALIAGVIMISAASIAVIRTDGTLTGRGTSGDPVGVDTSATGKIATDYDIIIGGKHWWNSNLTATGNRTHNAAKKSSTVNNLTSWTTNAGVLDPMSFVQDSTDIGVQGPGQFSVAVDDGIYLRAGTGFNPRIQMHDSIVDIIESHGNVTITTLDRFDQEDDVVGINSATGKLEIRNAAVQWNHTPSSNTDTGTAGQLSWDGTHLYVCTATNTWKRISLSTF